MKFFTAVKRTLMALMVAATLSAIVVPATNTLPGASSKTSSDSGQETHG